MSLTKLESLTLKSAGVTEKVVQDWICADPSVLGLGELDLLGRERIHARAGRLDLLLRDPDTLKRYEVELQLGTTDESHIIRTVEYWDIERKRYPQYEHTAVIVAEDISSRFLNVIQLFNGTIPLIALKMSAYRVGESVALTFTTVLNEMTLGLADEDEPQAEQATREGWEAFASKDSLRAVDNLLELVQEVQPKALLNYTQGYIGLKIDGNAKNFVDFVPKKSHVIAAFKLPDQGEEVKAAIVNVGGMTTAKYDSTYGRFRVRIDRLDVGAQRPILTGLIQQAWEHFGKP